MDFKNPYDMFGWQTCQTNCLFQTNTAVLHFCVSFKHAFTFSFDDEIFESEKIFVTVYFIATTKELGYCS